MVLCHGNSGKILSLTFSQRREEYKEHPEGFSDSEKAWFESSTVTNAGNADPVKWLVETTPMDWPEGSGPQLVDVRQVDVLKHEGRD